MISFLFFTLCMVSFHPINADYICDKTSIDMTYLTKEEIRKLDPVDIRLGKMLSANTHGLLDKTNRRWCKVYTKSYGEYLINLSCEIFIRRL